MTTEAQSTPPATPPTPSPESEFDPDSYRMTMGEHLEELRRRLIIALAGMAVAALGCFYFGEDVFTIFCRPLIQQLQKQNLNPQIFYSELGEPFMVYIKVSLVCAAVLSAPWMLYQIWQFVAAGLYPHERKYITKYVPLSIALLIAGMIFVYFIVLPWTIGFFLAFGNGIQLSNTTASHIATTVPTLPIAPILNGDPPHPTPGQFWFNELDGRLKFFLKDGDQRVILFGPSNLLSPHVSLPEYIDLVLTTLLTFGLCFQLPLVVLTLTKIGIVNVDMLKKSRRYVYFGLSILAATMTPGDVVTAMLALMAPLILLYELGIFLSAWNAPEADASVE
jgi:sec-independent protein translocase protein TatC